MRIIPRRESFMNEKDNEASVVLKTTRQPLLQQEEETQLNQKSNQKKESKIKDQIEGKIIKKEIKRSLLDEVLEEQAALED